MSGTETETVEQGSPTQSHQPEIELDNSSPCGSSRVPSAEKDVTKSDTNTGEGSNVRHTITAVEEGAVVLNVEESEDPYAGMSKKQARKLRLRLFAKERKREYRKTDEFKSIRSALCKKRKVSLRQCRTMAASESRVRIAIDCAYDSLMANSDIRHLTNQLAHAYSANRRLVNPVQFYITNIDGQLAHRCEKELTDFVNWDVHQRTEPIDEVFIAEEIVYLSSESDDVLDELRDDVVYVIGGLVDHNHHKGVCHTRAVAAGWRHARLPLEKYVKLSGRSVLTITAVYEILARLSIGEDWSTALRAALPARAVAAFLDADGNAISEEECGDAEESVGEDIVTECIGEDWSTALRATLPARAVAAFLDADGNAIPEEECGDAEESVGEDIVTESKIVTEYILGGGAAIDTSNKALEPDNSVVSTDGTSSSKLHDMGEKAPIGELVNTS